MWKYGDLTPMINIVYGISRMSKIVIPLLQLSQWIDGLIEERRIHKNRAHVNTTLASGLVFILLYYGVWISIYSALLTFCCKDIVLNVIIDWFTYFAIWMAAGCDGAPLLPLLFVLVNMGFNISLLHLLKISSAIVSSLASTFSGI